MQERHLTGGVSPEVEAEHTHYVEAWGGDPKEAYPEYDLPHGGWLSDVVILEEPSALLPTAEEQAEQMEMGEEYMTRGTGVEDNKDSVDNGMGEEEDLHGVDDEEEDIGVNEEEELCGVVEEEEDFDGVDDEEEEEMAEEEDLCGVVNEEEDLEGVGEGEEEERDEEEDLDGVDRVGVNEDTGRVDKREGKKRVAHSCVLIRAWSPMRGRDEEELPVRAPCGQKEGKQISFNNIKEVFCYAVESSTDSNSIQETDEDEDEEEDPVIMAENLEFNSKAYSDLEKQVEEQGDAAFFHITDSEEEGSVLESKRAKAQGLGTLRKRKRREPE